jgi:predicted DNA-binding protein
MTEAKKSVVVSIRLDDATHSGLAALAKVDRRKLATYLAMVLEDHLVEKVASGAVKPSKATKREAKG